MGRQISRDDIEDIEFLSTNINDKIYEILDDVDVNIGMSALISSMVHLTFDQSRNLKELLYFKHCLDTLFTESIDLAKQDGFFS